MLGLLKHFYYYSRSYSDILLNLTLLYANMATDLIWQRRSDAAFACERDSNTQALKDYWKTKRIRNTYDYRPIHTTTLVPLKQFYFYKNMFLMLLFTSKVVLNHANCLKDTVVIRYLEVSKRVVNRATGLRLRHLPKCRVGQTATYSKLLVKIP